MCNKRKQTMTDNPHILVAAVHYKPTIYRKSQIREHIRIQSDVAEQVTKDWKDEFAVSTLYNAFRQLFIDILSQLQSM